MPLDDILFGLTLTNSCNNICTNNRVFRRPGSYFGERALLSDETRKATCVAIGRTVCLSLGE